ncbi:hypothetical protein [Xanthomonas phage JGB6]|nr:hypothetical protein [Xanthomonas phage JGB6]
MENSPNNAALQILAKAAELYLNGLDELARAFAIPQINQAVQNLAQLIKVAEALLSRPLRRFRLMFSKLKSLFTGLSSSCARLGIAMPVLRCPRISKAMKASS